MAAQSVKHPEFRSLKEVQQSRREFDSRLGHKGQGKILARPSVGVGSKAHVCKNKSVEWANGKTHLEAMQ